MKESLTHVYDLLAKGYLFQENGILRINNYIKLSSKKLQRKIPKE